MANPTLQLHFGCGRATPPVSHSHNWPSGRMQNFLFKIGQKSYFFANKDPKTNFDDWMILQKHVLSFKCNDFFKMANLKAISSSATLNLLHGSYIQMENNTYTGICYSGMLISDRNRSRLVIVISPLRIRPNYVWNTNIVKSRLFITMINMACCCTF